MPIEEALRRLARDPDYLTNPDLATLFQAVERRSAMFGWSGDRPRRIAIFAGMHGEAVGHLFSPMLCKQVSSDEFKDVMLHVAHHCALAVDENVGLPFYVEASTFFASCGISRLNEPPEPELPGILQRYADVCVSPVLATEAGRALLKAAECATTAFLSLVRIVARCDESEMIDVLASCYSANMHLQAAAIEMWLLLETQKS